MSARCQFNVIFLFMLFFRLAASAQYPSVEAFFKAQVGNEATISDLIPLKVYVAAYCLTGGHLEVFAVAGCDISCG